MQAPAIARIFAVLLLAVLQAGIGFAQVVGNEERDARAAGELQSYLQQYPAADADGDGVLAAAERDQHRRQTVLAKFPAGATNFFVRIPMRDGVRLATEVFLPSGAGPWPVVLTRTAYGRWSAALRDAGSFGRQAVAFVTQDLRGDGDSEGAGTFDPLSFDNEIEDGYDAVEWIARQPWCNGRVGIQGTSGHGFAGCMALLANPPHLAAVHSINSGGNAYLYWTFQNGARRYMYNWMANRNTAVSDWPKPTIQMFDRAAYDARVRQSAASNQAVFIASSGWYDIFAESALDYLAAYGGSQKIFVTMNASGHGAMQGLKFPKRPLPPSGRMPDFVSVLKGGVALPARSLLLYYLMGDVSSSNAPGNVWKTAHTWPLPHTPTRFYLNGSGGLSPEPSGATNVGLSFICSPTNPVPTLGGAMMGSPGPMDQRPLAGRPDLLRFTSAPLTAPLEITGKVRAHLYVSTDVPDCMLVVKLVDVYPDGYEALIREGAMTARFWRGLDQPEPLATGRVYKLDLDLWSTAYVFNAGHQLAVYVAGNDAPKYEIHPHTYAPCDGWNNAVSARHTVHLSGAHASCLILPVIAE